MILKTLQKKVDNVKLEQWFSKLAPNATGLKKELKEKLKESLVLSESWKSKGGPEGSMLIVPMNESYRLKNNANKQVKNYLTIELDAGGNYTNGFIWQIAAGSSITNTTFYNLYMGFEGGLNGSYDKLDVWDNLISRSKYENGKPKSFGQVETKKTNAQRTGGLVCTEYYEVTTHYDIVTGEVLSQTSEYLYTTCICSSPNTVQSTILGPGDCDNSGGGNEGGDCSNSELELNTYAITGEAGFWDLSGSTISTAGNEVTKKVSWKCYQYTNGVGMKSGWKSNERMKMVQWNGNGAWQFKPNGITHDSYTKFGTFMFYSSSLVERNPPTISIPTSDLAKVQVHITVTLSLVCKGSPIERNDETDPEGVFIASSIANL